MNGKRTALTLLLTLGTTGAHAGDDDPAPADVVAAVIQPEAVGAKPLTGPARSVPLATLPARARTALRKLAKAENASLSRATVVEQDGQLIYEFYGVRRRGLLGREEVLLTTFREPVEAAEARKHEQSLGRRFERLGQALTPESRNDAR